MTFLMVADCLETEVRRGGKGNTKFYDVSVEGFRRD